MILSGHPGYISTESQTLIMMRRRHSSWSSFGPHDTLSTHEVCREGSRLSILLPTIRSVFRSRADTEGVAACGRNSGFRTQPMLEMEWWNSSRCYDLGLNVERAGSLDLVSLNPARLAQLHVSIVMMSCEKVLQIRVQCVRTKLWEIVLGSKVFIYHKEHLSGCQSASIGLMRRSPAEGDADAEHISKFVWVSLYRATCIITWLEDQVRL
jgi:hypothetical protein